MIRHKGCSYRSLAKELGISATYLYDIENGKRLPNIELYEKMCKCGKFDKTWLDTFEVIVVKKVVYKMW